MSEQQGKLLLARSRAVCFGWNGHGQCGVGNSTTVWPSVLSVQGDDSLEIQAVAASGFHTLAIVRPPGSSMTTVYAWGSNSQRQLGIDLDDDDDRVCFPVPIVPLFGKGIRQVACGSGHSVALSAHGALFSWGKGADGQLGRELHSLERGEYDPYPRAVESLADKDVRRVACGFSFTVTVTAMIIITHSQAVCTHSQGVALLLP